MIEDRPGDADYGKIGSGYAAIRRADPRIAAAIADALGEAKTILNVGAGAGSYEPTDRYVLAVEPAPAMRAQRPVSMVPAIDARAGSLPLDDGAVDAGMAVLTVHHWPDLTDGLRDLRRVVKGPVVVFTFDPAQLDRLWLMDYSPELLAVERRRYPSIESIAAGLGGQIEVRPIPIPHDCTDGFSEAFYSRPEAFLRPEVRQAQSAWSFVDDEAETRAVADLTADLESGFWDERYGELRSAPVFNGAVRLVVSR